MVGGAPRLNDDKARREAAELDGVGIRQHAHRIDRIVGKRPLAQAGGRIDKHPGPELHTGLTRTASLDRKAAWYLDDAGDQPQRRLHTASRCDLLELFPVDRFGRAERSCLRQDGSGRHDFHAFRHEGDPQIERQLSLLSSRHDDRGCDRLESLERCRDRVASGLEIFKRECPIALRKEMRDIRRAIEERHHDPTERDGGLRLDDPVHDAVSHRRRLGRQDALRQSRLGAPTREQKNDDERRYRRTIGRIEAHRTLYCHVRGSVESSALRAINLLQTSRSAGSAPSIRHDAAYSRKKSAPGISSHVDPV